MKKAVIYFAIFLTGCNSQNKIELEILTKEINCKNVKGADYPNYMKMDTIAVEESRTIVVYKLTNNSNKTYYFNLEDYNDDFRYKYIKINKAHIAIYDSNGKYQKPHTSSPSGGFEEKRLYSEYLDYNYRGRLHDTNQNFIIHPHETLYFEWFIVLPFGNMLENINYSVLLDAKKKYYAEVLMHSDSTGFKKSISRTDLNTIQDNGYEVYNGTIKSKNRIPIVFK
jgi:hypothetical protein